ncbi:3'-5' exoribonuclease YhaM family protein [Geopsychrobacter electrodiphilus]|uniref:3'-5' exoribonuclease YhaM family protein n=1 Tax=Geopsychrobacter electrodiphilus TaxID=225196 RepID=UPI00036D65D7|nr:HD domain-containing protein [Geopsychrobacter electrodiphilus]
MKQIYVNQIGERDQVEAVFLVRECTQAMARNGKPYMTLKLMDRTGEIEARVWDRVEEWARLFAKNDFLQISGRGNLYMGKMQLVVQDLKKVSEDSIDLADFMPVSKRPLVEMRGELDELLASMTDGPFGELMRAFFADAKFFKLYSRAPAAKGMHHVFLGGLLEHSLAVAALACDIAKRYAQVDRDLLIAGALMHDVGKIAELSYERSFDYTDEGKLIGHIVMGVEMIEERSRTIPDFPRQQVMLLKHLLLSHHGQYEYGSPKRPKILEAVILSFIDDLDSKINGIQTHIDKEPARTGDWTGYHRLYDRYFYAPLEPQDAAIVEATAPVAQRPQTSEPAKVYRSRNEPLGFTLGEKLAGQNLPLFGNDKKDK